MKHFRTAAALLTVCLFLLCACQGDYSQHEAAAPETISAEQIMEMIRTAEESLRAAESEAALPETTSPEILQPDSTLPETSSSASVQTGIVYWTTGGEVWHTDPSCSSLSNAKQIFSGTVDGAENAGKARACKRCG